jgi:hypothetical protein
MEPQKGKQPGCNAGATSCAGLLQLPECKASCAEEPGSDGHDGVLLEDQPGGVRSGGAGEDVPACK